MMIRDPYTGHQLRYYRRLLNPNPISGPWIGQVSTRWYDYAAVAVVVLMAVWTIL